MGPLNDEKKSQVAEKNHKNWEKMTNPLKS